MLSTTIYTANHKQARPCATRDGYLYLRRHTRRLRRHSPTHYDVSWFADSLGLTPYSTACTVRGYGTLGIIRPVGKLP
jgi:hypothetical protein